ncbi:hypothetical protein CITRIK5_60034 [Citricoccus sp. K5]|nr:hypothetical protein CITRIK5_60034 [Citricoccus sp. K5]
MRLLTITWMEAGETWSSVDSPGTALAVDSFGEVDGVTGVGVAGGEDGVTGLDMMGGDADTDGEAVALSVARLGKLSVADPIGGSSVVEQPVSSRARTPRVRRGRAPRTFRPSGGARG